MYGLFIGNNVFVFVPFFISLVAEINSQGRWDQPHSSESVLWLLMTWWHQDPGHQQAGYWPSLHRILPYLDRKDKMTVELILEKYNWGCICKQILDCLQQTLSDIDYYTESRLVDNFFVTGCQNDIWCSQWQMLNPNYNILISVDGEELLMHWRYRSLALKAGYRWFSARKLSDIDYYTESRLVDNFFVTGCQNDNIWCSQWQMLNPNYNILISVDGEELLMHWRYRSLALKAGYRWVSARKM